MGVEYIAGIKTLHVHVEPEIYPASFEDNIALPKALVLRNMVPLERLCTVARAHPGKDQQL